MRWILALTCASLAAAPLHAQSRAPRTGDELLARMHDRYAGKWYSTLTFTQETRRGGAVQTWYEAAAIPGRLRIDVAPVDSGNAFMFVDDSVFGFRNGKPGRGARDRNLLLTLGFDVYGQAAATTAAQLRAEGVALSRVHAGSWKGTPVWVVGAAAGDTTSNQFWVEQQRLLFVRLIQQTPRPGKADVQLDAEFNDYRPLAGGWIAMNVVVRADGQVIQEEHYSNPRANEALDPSLWDHTTYHQPAWIH